MQSLEESRLNLRVGGVLIHVALLAISIQLTAEPVTAKSWPEAPMASKRVVIEPPLPAIPVNDRLQVEVTDGPFRGRLLFAPTFKLPGEVAAGSYFVIRGVGTSGLIEGKPTSVAAYPAWSTERISRPQFAPNGQSVLFNVGNPEFRYGEYGLYLWKLAAQQVQPIGGFTLSYPIVKWAPDSRFLAFIKGGDAHGNPVAKNRPLLLGIYDTEKLQERVVAQLHNAVDFVWSQQGTMLYSKEPETPSNNNPKTPSQNSRLMALHRPSIYEVSATGGEARIIIKDGQSPSPSPDGKSIAFWGWPPDPSEEKVINNSVNEKNARKPPVQLALYIFDRVTKKRTLVGPFKSGFLRWTPDSKGLIVVDTTFRKNATGQEQGEANIHRIDALTLKSKLLATLNAVDFESGTRSTTNPQFLPDEVSKDSQFLFVEVSEHTGQEQGYYTETKSLQAVDLSNGTISQVARLNSKWGSLIGWDWQED